MAKMKAVYCAQYGPPEVLRIVEREKPGPKDDEVLIKVHFTTANAADCNIRGLSFIPTGLGLLARLMLGFSKPKFDILGSVVAGEVTETGKKVTSFKVGDRVIGTGPELGGYAEYSCRSEKGALALIPPNVSYQQASTIPYGGLTALYFLRDKANVKQGQKVLVIGASGSVGVYAIQLAKYFGAHVTGVCSSSKVDFVKSLGADEIIDYTKEDLEKRDETWDIIFNVVVGKTSYSRHKHLLTRNGYYLAVAGGLPDMLNMAFTSFGKGRKVIFGGGTDCEKKENLTFIANLINDNKLNAVIDRTFRFSEIVDAHKYVEAGDKKGNIVISIP